MWPSVQVRTVGSGGRRTTWSGVERVLRGRNGQDQRVERLRWAVLRLGVRLACLRRREGVAASRLRQATGRRPADLEIRLLLAEIELTMGDVDRAIAEAGIAIQLAPDDLRGMTLLLRAQARSELQAS